MRILLKIRRIEPRYMTMTFSFYRYYKIIRAYRLSARLSLESEFTIIFHIYDMHLVPKLLKKSR